jgi:hypothetical protein
VVTFLNWFPGWPDGNYIDRGKYWHVWVYKTGETGMITEGVNTPICFACSGRTSELQVLRLRGLCEASQFDRTYILAASGPEPLFYQGDRHTNLTYLADRGGWLLTSVRSNKGKTEPLLPPVTAFTEVVVLLSGRPILAPRLLWPPSCSANTTSSSRATTTAGDRRCECAHTCPRKLPGFTQRLLFTSCSDTEFTCGDGLCVPMALRCNQIIDCPNDSSDEEECAMVRFPDTYKTEFAPVEARPRSEALFPTCL